MGTTDTPETALPGKAPVDPHALREEVRSKYREVAHDPHGDHHFHTGRPLARRLGYPEELTEHLPEVVIESFAGIANPFSLRPLRTGERVVDVGSGAGFDSVVAAQQVGPTGSVTGLDMTADMLAKARANAAELGLDHVSFTYGFAEELPVEDGSADVVISNGVFNLCPDKQAVLAEAKRALAPGGWLQFGDIANGAPVPEEARSQIDLWTG